MRGAARGLLLPAAFAAAGLLCAGAPDESAQGGSGGALALRSPSFAAMGEIPRRHTCEGQDLSPELHWSGEGQDLSPELHWSGVPDGTRSFVLIVDDPDAPDPANPRTTWVHWVLYDVPADATGLPEAVPASALPPGTRQGANDWKRTGYRGPCPPIGRHRYVHKLYALDAVLGDLGPATKAEVERAMHGKVLAQAELVGTYQKGR